MLEPWIIEEIKRREQDHREQPQLPAPPPPEPRKKPRKDGGTVIVIEL